MTGDDDEIAYCFDSSWLPVECNEESGAFMCETWGGDFFVCPFACAINGEGCNDFWYDYETTEMIDWWAPAKFVDYADFTNKHPLYNNCDLDFVWQGVFDFVYNCIYDRNSFK